MLKEREFELIKTINGNKFLKREDFPSDSEFDYLCNLAIEMLEKGIFRTSMSTPYVLNRQGSGPKYSIVGKLELSTEAQDLLRFESYSNYTQSIRKSPFSDIGNRLNLLGIVVSISAIIVSILLAI
ncbi:hypothetical protein [Shewanella baltica]|uniref:hypothetical protein n=1 Tax=Shewanella baltica TaxID=62322 RepID=UPI00217DD1BD|nr:hypothetical protein [Shewanella baltica]MCS6192131.1 hypothetical protein [Shewanella baltica]